jgi:4-hydroxybenzoate polyprenyltransferase
MAFRTQTVSPAVAKFRLFLALSRSVHGSLDMAAPFVGALLWLGGLPSLRVGLIGAGTIFAGYTAVYALNDLLGRGLDRDKLRLQFGEDREDPAYLDAVFMRHPLAQGALAFGESLAWTLFWALCAVIGAWILNPVCVAVFLGASLLEALYCRLFKVTPLRTLVNGAVKTAGPLAGVLAVDPSPSPAFLGLLLGSFLLWEVGGQNIPADWSDLETDRSLAARTIPVVYGKEAAAKISLISLGGAVLASPFLFALSPLATPWWILLAVAGLGCLQLLVPVIRLVLSLHQYDAMHLFNRASLWPPSLLLVILLGILAQV